MLLVCLYFLLRQFLQDKSEQWNCILRSWEGVPSAADCATLCGQRHFFCQSAIYNHDVRSCALSPNRPIQCSLSKQRFNYFHLKTDGADALSLLACIQICQQQPTTSTTTNSLTEDVLNKEEIKRTTIKQQQPLEFSPIHDEEEKSSLRNKKMLECLYDISGKH
uniref:Apple domain-containing protein n=1 Tax=Meloidogyne incognita TaxID=6306 RepID=A0A914MDW0_MELIC